MNEIPMSIQEFSLRKMHEQINSVPEVMNTEENWKGPLGDVGQDMIVGLQAPKPLNIAQPAFGNTLKIPVKEPKKRYAPEQATTYFNSEALWKRNFKVIDRSRDTYTKKCRNKWRMPNSNFVSDSPIRVTAPGMRHS